MDVQLEFETICINCQELGYNFGFTIKGIMYQGISILDTPQQYLNGPCLAFHYQGVPFFIRSLENSHQLGMVTSIPIFTMINAKKSPSITRFTYTYVPDLHPDLIKGDPSKTKTSSKIFEYVDTYQFKAFPYLLIYYSFRNSTPYPLEDVHFYNLYDFDIYGHSHYNKDCVEYNPELQAIYQYNAEKGINSSVHAGFGSTTQNPPSHFEGSTTEKIMITPNRLLLRDHCETEPDDYASALQWSIPLIPPGHLQIFPIMLIFSQNHKEFAQNVVKAREHLEQLLPSIYKVTADKYRQLIDPALEKMSFSTRQWCK